MYNSSAGLAVLPESVLQETADEMLDYKGSGMSIMEISYNEFHAEWEGRLYFDRILGKVRCFVHSVSSKC